ncbi:hypothetical protein ScPMuIL_010640 [Solemya velum]
MCNHGNSHAKGLTKTQARERRRKTCPDDNVYRPPPTLGSERRSNTSRECMDKYQQQPFQQQLQHPVRTMPPPSQSLAPVLQQQTPTTSPTELDLDNSMRDLGLSAL